MFERRHGYVRGEVLPALEERGFCAREQYRRLRLFGAYRWVLTPVGQAARTNLQAKLAGGNDWSGGRTVADDLRAYAGVPRGFGSLDAAWAAIDVGVREGWDDYVKAHDYD